MENADINAPKILPVSTWQKNKWPITGFILMLSGPAVLIAASLLKSAFGNLPQAAANIISLLAAALPGMGAVISIAWLFRRKKMEKLGRALVIVTVLMCNPLFYFYYLLICLIVSSELAGVSWM